MTAETLVYDIVNWVLCAETKEECVSRFEQVINNPPLRRFLAERYYRELICKTILQRGKDESND